MHTVLVPVVADLLTKVLAHNSVAGIWSSYLTAAARVGLGHGLACFLPRDHNINQTVFGISMPAGWMENYVARDYWRADPLSMKTFASPQPFAWKIQEWERSGYPLTRGWHGDNVDFRLTAGISIPDRSGGDLKVISIAGDRPEMSRADRAALEYAGIIALGRMQECDLAIPEQISHGRLSNREREIFNWIAAGKSDWEIGCILSISEKTVNTHVERAKHKLRATTRTQAVILALREGTIAP